ncbi:YeiH family protein [uncultured Rikenella sp.]|uniref:YeiH family protein n=1 Tax=uncultured Rikenella sp. TaxID=368003 RepID=UPI00260A40FA|nr:YeiH family protein [uncultured Rikenella sp.]
MLHGILLIALFTCAAFWIAETDLIRSLSLSPLIVGIVLGMLYANSLRNRLPATWVPGILFCSKQLLRTGIILYGFNLTFQDIVQVGLPAIIIDTLIVATTISGGVLIGRLLRMDKGIALLTSVGSGICGAAAVLGAEATIRTKPYKTAVAVSTVVIFGTLAMFLYPALYRSGTLELEPAQMGLYTGATLHEVAHVVGAGNAMGQEISDTAIIVKMIRVILLVPVLLIISFTVSRIRMRKRQRRGNASAADNDKGKISIPWFAIGFLGVIAFNSLGLLPAGAIAFIKQFDVFLLTMAMTALGAETSIEKFRKAGFKPFLLAAILFVWLVAGGWVLAKYVAPGLM